MFDVVLVHPEIPPNTGNVIRLCANAGARLHLVEPLGFSIDDKQLRRAGLDYHDLVDVVVHRDWARCTAELAGRRMFATSTRGSLAYTAVDFQIGDVIVFGPESGGLPPEIIATFSPSTLIRIPMKAGSRSLNLSNTVAVVLYEAWRQNGFRVDCT
ncbi:MAG TPA: tRNA (cytidine(34)-2'-O)-methyltransferase [Usitatibacter sp.]